MIVRAVMQRQVRATLRAADARVLVGYLHRQIARIMTAAHRSPTPAEPYIDRTDTPKLRQASNSLSNALARL